MVRLALLSLAVTFAGAPLNAQVASVAVFGPMPAAAVSVADGTRTSEESDFTLYELGRWDRPKRDGSLSLPLADTVTMLPGGPQVVAQPVSGRCSTGAAPPRSLAARASLGRRLFWPIIANAECRFGLPAGLMDSLVLAESRYDPKVVSPAGAVGLAQLMPGTAMDLGIADRFDPSASVVGGARYLRQLLDSFEGNIPLALAAYNAGPAAVRRTRGIPLNGETPDYVRRVLGYWTAPGIGPMSPMLSARQTAQMLGFGPTATN